MPSGKAAPMIGTTIPGQPIDSGSIGTKQFLVFAADQAGNPVYRSAWYRVIFPFNGFAPPIAASGWTDVKAADGVPLKFSLGGDYGLDVLTAAMQQQVDCASGDAVDPASPASGAFTYNASLARYMYAWAGNKAWAGTCRSVTLTLSDGTTHRADFRMTK
jgi:hypothetical protein